MTQSTSSEQKAREPHHRREIASTVLLSLAGVVSTWSAYQAARWNGLQATLFNEASTARTRSESRALAAVEETSFDASMFVQYAAALIEDKQTVAHFLYARFRPEMKIALDAWLATRPLQSAHGPPSPFVMPEYALDETNQARQLARVADEKFASAKAANLTADKYVLLTVLFTTVLFFGGVGSKTSSRGGGRVMLGVGVAIFVVAGVALSTFPLL